MLMAQSAGGYTRAILDAAPCRVIAFDRDDTAHSLAAQWELPYAGRLTRVHSSFGEMRARLTEMGVDRVDAIILDLGVSSMQFDEGERGFSFRFDAPLDMVMDRSSGATAADIVNGTPEKELADLIYLYGEETRVTPYCRSNRQSPSNRKNHNYGATREYHSRRYPQGAARQK